MKSKVPQTIAPHASASATIVSDSYSYDKQAKPPTSITVAYQLGEQVVLGGVVTVPVRATGKAQ